MILGINEIPTLKKLLSPAMYTAYIKYKHGIINNDNFEDYEDDFEDYEYDPEYGGYVVTNYDDEDDVLDETYEMAAFNILRKALYYTPVDTGNLRDSSYIKPYKRGYEVGYTADYAIHVHEIGFNRHEYPTRYKFLEDAAYETLEEYYAETGDLLDIKIQYDPLRVFVGVKDAPGQNISSVRIGPIDSNKIAAYRRLLNVFNNFDVNTAAADDIAYYNKMKAFFDYYKKHRKYQDMDIIMEWMDRQRHE